MHKKVPGIKRISNLAGSLILVRGNLVPMLETRKECSKDLLEQIPLKP